MRSQKFYTMLSTASAFPNDFEVESNCPSISEKRNM